MPFGSIRAYLYRNRFIRTNNDHLLLINSTEYCLYHMGVVQKLSNKKAKEKVLELDVFGKA